MQVLIKQVDSACYEGSGKQEELKWIVRMRRCSRRYRSGQSRPLRWCSGARTGVLLPSVPLFLLGGTLGRKQVAGWVGNCASPFWRAEYANKWEENSCFCQLYDISQSHSANSYNFSPVFGSQTSIPVVNVEKPCKYFDLDLCSQLNGLSHGFYSMDSEQSAPALEWWGIKLRLLILFVGASQYMLTLYLWSGKVQPNFLVWFSVFCVGLLRGYK